jgi:hypothetical protein
MPSLAGVAMLVLCSFYSGITSVDGDICAVCCWPGLQAPKQGAENTLSKAEGLLEGAESGLELRVDSESIGAIRQELVPP